MIVEELIMFEREHLKYNQSFETQLSLTKKFLSKFPPLNSDKLKLFIDMLKEDQSKLSYRHFSKNYLVLLLLSIVLISFMSMLSIRLYGLGRSVFKLLLILIIVSLATTTFGIRRRKKQKHKLIIQVLEHLYFEQWECIIDFGRGMPIKIIKIIF